MVHNDLWHPHTFLLQVPQNHQSGLGADPHKTCNMPAPPPIHRKVRFMVCLRERGRKKSYKSQAGTFRRGRKLLSLDLGIVGNQIQSGGGEWNRSWWRRRRKRPALTQGHLLINAHKCHSAFSIMRVPAYIEPHCFNGSPPFELVLQISAKMPSPPPAKKILENLQTLAVHRRCHHGRFKFG